GTLIYENKIRKFAVSAGVGLDAAICHQVVVSKLKTILNKIGLGKLTYAGVALNQIIISSPKHMSLILDHDKKFEFKSAYMAAIMNVCYEGGGVKFCPRAVPNDGKLDILVLADIPKLKILTLLPTAFMGKHIHFKGVHTYTCRDISIHLESPQPAHTDGEPVSLQQHISACCADSQLRIIST
ncbi:MAG: diacylglycerol kinase family lipid kinase, partial [Lachnospiraceae bacterium]